MMPVILTYKVQKIQCLWGFQSYYNLNALIIILKTILIPGMLCLNQEKSLGWHPLPVKK